MRASAVRTILDAASAGAGTVANLSARAVSDRTVDAGFLRSVYLGDAGPLGPGGFVLRGASIEGVLDLEQTAVAGIVHLETCQLRETPNLAGSAIGHLGLVSCELPGLIADGVVARSVFVLDCDVGGPLHLSNSRIDGPLSMQATRVSGDGRKCVELYGADIGGPLLMWRTDQFGGRHCRFRCGAVRMIDARVGGQLNLAGAEFDFPDDWALSAFNIDVRGSCFLNGVVATGGILFRGARIGGDFLATGATLRGIGQRDAMNAVSSHIGGEVRLNDGFASKGRVELTSASIGGAIVLSGGTFVRSHPNPDASARRDWDDVAISLDGCTARAVFARRSPGIGPTRCVGRVRAFGATVSGPFRAEGARFQNASGDALDLSRSVIGTNLRLSELTMSGSLASWGASFGGGATIGGDLRARSGVLMVLRGSSVKQDLTLGTRDRPLGPGAIDMEHCTVGAMVDASWLASGTVLNLENGAVGVLKVASTSTALLTGLRLGTLRIGEGDRGADLAAHLEFLRKQVYQPAAYTRLAVVAGDRGDATYARRLRIERERRRWQQAPTALGRAAGWVLHYTIGFGFEPARALIWAVGLVFGLGLFLAAVPKARQVLVAVDKQGGAYTASNRPPSNPLPEAGSGRCGTDFPCFNPWAFSVDTVVPLVNLGQRDAWRALPRGRAGHLVQLLLWCLALSGWVLATLVAAGLSRVVRNE